MSPKRDPATGEPRDGIDLTNLDQPLSPDADASKRDVVDYLDAVADRILPGVVGRRPVPRRTTAAKEQHVQRRASRQDQHLCRADHATRCRRRGSPTPQDQARRAP
jgi:DNA primase